jgi:hypothetical protein
LESAFFVYDLFVIFIFRVLALALQMPINEPFVAIKMDSEEQVKPDE